MAATSSSDGFEQGLPRLLAAVRRRLWLAQTARAARAACWICAGGVLVALALHLAVAPVPVAAVQAGLALTWLAAAAWALWQRPGDATCALWADRHLGGASAFTTWLDLSHPPAAAPAAAAHRQLERWLAAQLPASLRLLATQPAALRLTRPLLAMLVCLGLLAAVLSLRQAAVPAPAAPAANVLAATGTPPPLAAVDPAAVARASALARAARSAASRGAAPGSDEGSGRSAAQPAPDDARALARPDTDGTPRAAAPLRGGADAAGSVDAQAAAGEAGRAGRGSAGQGRDLGDSRDDRADVGVSRAARASFGMPASALPGRPGVGAWQADADESASYAADGSPTERDAGSRLPEPAAARPPPATDSLGLGPTETSYVQAWMKASAQRR